MFPSGQKNFCGHNHGIKVMLGADNGAPWRPDRIFINWWQIAIFAYDYFVIVGADCRVVQRLGNANMPPHLTPYNAGMTQLTVKSVFILATASVGLALSTNLFLAPLGYAQQSPVENPALGAAKDLETKGNLADAIAKYREALIKEPANDSIKAALLGLYCKTEPKSKSEREFRLGQAAQFLGDLAGAAFHYQTAISTSPGGQNLEVHEALERLFPLINSTAIVLPPAKREQPTPWRPSEPISIESYMRQVQKIIKSNWHPPNDSISKKVITVFTLGKTGELTTSSVKQSSGNPDADAAALKAIRTSHFSAPPPGSVSIQFTFDYNVFFGRKDGTVMDAISDGIPVERPSRGDLSSLHFAQIHDRQIGRNYAEYFVRKGDLSKAAELYLALTHRAFRSTDSDGFEKAILKSEHECVMEFIALKNISRSKSLRSGVFECLRKLDKTKSFTSHTIDMLQKQLVDVLVSHEASLPEIANGLKTQTAISVETKLSFTDFLRRSMLFSHKDKQNILALEGVVDSYKAIEVQLIAADEMERKAFKFECHGNFNDALNLYQKAAVIKRKELGALHEEALLGEANIARVLSELGRTAESQHTYEATITLFRKTKVSGSNYAMVLENYGNMLNQNGQYAKASKLYNEAIHVATRSSG